jgi:hypothetical protein
MDSFRSSSHDEHTTSHCINQIDNREIEASTLCSEQGSVFFQKLKMITAGVLIFTVNVLVLSHASALPWSPTHFPPVDSAVVRRPEGIASIFSLNDPRTGIDLFQSTKTESQGDSKVSKIVGLRGGSATNVFSDFSNYIVDSKTRCWIVLLIAILLDTFSTMLMKIGRDESSPPKLRAAYCGYLLR